MTVDPVAVAARLKKEGETNARMAAIIATEQQTCATHGEKICLNTRTCSAAIPQDAKVCPECGKRQAQSGSGHTSGVNRGSRRNPIVLNLGGAR